MLRDEPCGHPILRWRSEVLVDVLRHRLESRVGCPPRPRGCPPSRRRSGPREQGPGVAVPAVSGEGAVGTPHLLRVPGAVVVARAGGPPQGADPPAPEALARGDRWGLTHRSPFRVAKGVAAVHGRDLLLKIPGPWSAGRAWSADASSRARGPRGLTLPAVALQILVATLEGGLSSATRGGGPHPGLPGGRVERLGLEETQDNLHLAPGGPALGPGVAPGGASCPFCSSGCS